MAVKKEKEVASIYVRVVSGTNGKGGNTYKYLNFHNINPELVDADALDIGKKLGGLQKQQFAGVYRRSFFGIVDA